jgi:hypothetical protein
MGDPVLRALAEAPEADEPLSEKDREAIREAEDEIRRGDVLSHEEVKRQLGL